MPTLATIGSMVLASFLHAWPLLALSIPLAVLLRMSGLSDRLRGAFGRRPIVGVLIATAAGAFGPFCSCGVIPIITSMLIAGVPLAPVMSFWIASPTMDPEIFFMSAAIIGWPLAVARLVATLIISLGAGLLTHWLVRRGWIGSDILRDGLTSRAGRLPLRTRTWRAVRGLFRRPRPEAEAGAVAAEAGACSCSCAEEAEPARPHIFSAEGARRLLAETLRATLWVAQLMTVAFVLEALIKFYVPQEVVVSWIGARNPLAPALATLIGIPMYTSNLTALPLVGGLLTQGMDPGAALAYLIAGPVTTIPAMAAVWGVVKRKVFLLYLGIGLAGALAAGYAFSAVHFMLGGGR
jgi:uncharacterized membrane protein YraQ (UPF0718 family)